MLKRKMEAPAEPETMTVTRLPVVEQESTVVVINDIDPEQVAEPVTDTQSEAVTELSEPEPEPDAADDVVPVNSPRTRGLPMVAFKPVEKDIAVDDEVPYAPPMAKSAYFADDDDDDDESGLDLSAPRKVMTDEELENFVIETFERNRAEAPLREAKEKARKEKEAKEAAATEAKRLAGIERRGSRRMLGNIMMAAGALGVFYGALVTFVPGM